MPTKTLRRFIASLPGTKHVGAESVGFIYPIYDEVLSVQLGRFDGSWTTVSRLALYRTKAGITPSCLRKQIHRTNKEGKGEASQ